MRFLVVFLLIFGINLGAKNIEEGLKFLEITNAKTEVLREAMIECYKQRQNYRKNNVIVEYGLLSEIAKHGYGSEQ